MNDANAFLMTPSSRVAQFRNIGDTVTGAIDSMQVVQQTDRQTGVPMTWNDGSLSIQYYANGEPSPGYDAPKLYRATYEPR